MTTSTNNLKRFVSWFIKYQVFNPCIEADTLPSAIHVRQLDTFTEMSRRGLRRNVYDQLKTSKVCKEVTTNIIGQEQVIEHLYYV